MSSTLFGGGVMTQVGVSQRTEATRKAIKDLQTELVELNKLPGQIRALEAMNSSQDRKIAALEAEMTALKALVASLTAAASTA